MKKTISKVLQGLLLVPIVALGLTFVPGVSVPANAQAACDNTLTITNGVNCAQGSNTPSSLFSGDNPIFKTIVNILLFIIGAISVIMLIIGGIRYVVSGGDSSAVTAAKNTILYAIVGIVIALLAFAAVNFVVGYFATPNS